MIKIIPDNYDAFVSYEREQERIERIHKRHEIEEEIENEELPFYVKGKNTRDFSRGMNCHYNSK